MLRRLFTAALAGVLAVSALNDYPTFYAQQTDNDYYAVQWQSEPAPHPPVEHDGESNADAARPHFPPHFPGHHPPKKANGTILSILSESPEFSRLFKVVNISDEIVSLLNDSSTNLTFFALPNHAIPKPPHHHRRPRDLSSDSVQPDLSLVDLISHVESIEVGGSELSARPSEEEIKKIVTAVLSYHIISDNLDLASLTKNATYPTKLSHVFGALNDEAIRLRIGSALPFARVNYYSQIVKPNIGAVNGFIHAINRPLLPPPSVFQTIFLLQYNFATFSSALQRTGLTGAVDYRITPESDANLASTEGSPVVTAFAPSNKAFAKLPRKLQLFLFSPFGERALKKLLQYHIVPDVAVFTDWVLNSTSDAVFDEFELDAILSYEELLAFEAVEVEHDFTEEAYSRLSLGHHVSRRRRRLPVGHESCPHPSPPPVGYHTFHEQYAPLPPPPFGHPPFSRGHAAPWPPSAEGHGACPHSPPSPFAHSVPPYVPPVGGHGAYPPPPPSGHAHSPPFEHHAPHQPPPFAAHGACSDPPPPTFEHQAPPSHCGDHGAYLPPPPFAQYGPPPSAYSHYGSPPPSFGHYGPPPPPSFGQYGPTPPSYFGGYAAYPPSQFTQNGPPPPPPDYGGQGPNFPAHDTPPPSYGCTAPPGKGKSRGAKHPLLKRPHFPHPPHVPLPRLDLVANFTLPTALEDHFLNVLVVKIPIKLPLPKHGKELGHITKVIVNGQPVRAYDGVALNGALHVVDRLISPRHGKGNPLSKPLPPPIEADYADNAREEETDDWEDWEDWLPAWVEN